MVNPTQEAISDLIDYRINIAIDRADQNPEYLTLCNQQNEVQKEIDANFSQDERRLIQELDENETAKNCIINQEVYIEGLRDGFRLIVALARDYENDAQLAAEIEKVSDMFKKMSGL